MTRPLKEPASANPLWRRFLKPGKDRAEDGTDAVLFTGPEQSKQPLGARDFVIIDECQVFPACMSDGAIAGQRDVLLRFDAVGDRAPGIGSEPENQFLGGTIRVIVYDDDVIVEQAVGALRFQRAQKIGQHRRPAKRAYADGDLRSYHDACRGEPGRVHSPALDCWLSAAAIAFPITLYPFLFGCISAAVRA